MFEQNFCYIDFSVHQRLRFDSTLFVWQIFFRGSTYPNFGSNKCPMTCVSTQHYAHHNDIVWIIRLNVVNFLASRSLLSTSKLANI